MPPREEVTVVLQSGELGRILFCSPPFLELGSWQSLTGISQRVILHARTAQIGEKVKSVRRCTMLNTEYRAMDANFLCYFKPKETLFRFNLFVSYGGTHGSFPYETNR